MVDWKNPLVIANQAEILVHIVHILSGLYLWEFIVAFPFEWAICTRKKAFKWSMLIYVACRWLTLFSLTLLIVVFNIKTVMNCSALIKAFTGLAHIAIGLTSVLLMLRAIALNGGIKVIAILLPAVLLTNWVTLIYGISTADAVWEPSTKLCSIRHGSSARLNVWVSFLSDIVLLVASIVGLLRKEGASLLWKFLFTQGLMHMAFSAIGYLLPAVFLILDLNDTMDFMFQPFALVVMTICATRMYRDLSDYMSFRPSHLSGIGRSFDSGHRAQHSPNTVFRSNTLPVSIEMQTVNDATSQFAKAAVGVVDPVDHDGSIIEDKASSHASHSVGRQV